MDNQGVTTSQSAISVGDWVLYLFILSIPLVNLIMLCIWAFGSEPNKTKVNFAKAGLIWIAILFVINILFGLAFFSLFSSELTGV